MENQFTIGERVIALSTTGTDKGQPRVKGILYTVKNVMYCSKCGIQAINIGELILPGQSHKVECYCGHVMLNEGLQWTASSQFAKIDYSSLKHAVEEEDYELACIIRDNLKP